MFVFSLTGTFLLMAENPVGLSVDRDSQRPDLDLSESSDVEDSLIESMAKRTIIREMEHLSVCVYFFRILLFFIYYYSYTYG